MKTQIIDNRKRDAFATGNWWGIVVFNEDSNFGMEFNTKREALWFITEGYKQFEI